MGFVGLGFLGQVLNGPTTSPNSYNDVLIGFWAKTQYSILNTQYIPAYPIPPVQIFHVAHLPEFWTGPESWQVVNMEYLHWGYGICKGCRYVLSIEY